MNLSLEGSVALVTGAAGHLGTEMVRQLAAAGARVAAADLTVNEHLTGLVADVTAQGGAAIALRIDITDTDSVTAALQQIGQQLGPLDILVNNAGVIKTNNPALPAVGSFYELDEALWKPLIDVNLCGTMRCTQLALRGMVERRRGRIINLASIAGVSGLPGWADYAASKGGIILFSQTLAMEVGKYGITVNCISPGMIAKDNTSHPNEGTWLGRSGTAEDIANMVVYLASPAGAYMTGTNILVDGGRVLGPKNARWDR